MAKPKANTTAAPIKASELGNEPSARVASDGVIEVELAPGRPGDVDELDEDDDEDLELDEIDGPPMPEPIVAQPMTAAPQGMPNVVHFQPVAPHQPRQIYSPDRTRHLSECGPVATGNFTAVIEGRRYDVKFGAPKARIPAQVQRAMQAAGVGFGMAPPPEGTGARAQAVKPKPPRARRTERRAEQPERKFRQIPVSAINAQPAF